MGVGAHAFSVCDGDVEDGVSGLGAEVGHEGEVELDLFGAGVVGQDDGGVGEIGFAGEGVAGVGEDLKVWQDGQVGDVLEVEVGVFEDGGLEVWCGGVWAVGLLASWKKKRSRMEFEKGRMSETGNGTMRVGEALSLCDSGVELI